MKTHFFVGNCVNSFNEETMEYISGSSFLDVNDFANVDDEFVNKKFHNPLFIKRLDGYIPDINDCDIISFVPERDIYIIYKSDEDIHYFYEKKAISSLTY